MKVCANAALGTLALLLSGCSLLPTAPKAQITATGSAGQKTVLAQSGNAALPANVKTTQVVQDLVLPPASTLTFDERTGLLSIRLSTATPMRATTETQEVHGATAFTPPSPPTEADKTDASVRLWAWLGLGAGVAVGLFGLVRGWDFVMYGGGCVAAACALVLFFKLIPVWVYILIGVGTALVLAGPLLWHTKLKPLANAPAKTAPPSS